jgi:hypothetical protein
MATKPAMIGILLDVSGSMKTAYSLDRSTDASVERTHAILTSVMNIVRREVDHYNRRESVFACAFGLSKYSDTCDLITLLEDFEDPSDQKKKLIHLASQHNAPHAEHWIENHLTETESRFLYNALCSDKKQILKLIELLPRSETTCAANLIGHVPLVGGAWRAGEDYLADRSEAYKFAQELIGRRMMQELRPRPVKVVCHLMDKLLQSRKSSSDVHDRIEELLKPIKPYIFGGTPMCRALNDAEKIFKQATETGTESQNVLFLLSDGHAADGDPHPIGTQLQGLNVKIATCFLTSDDIKNPKRLLYEAGPDWPDGDGRRVLFEMSSSMPNTHTPVSYLIDAGWELPLSGESRLFIQANSLDVVDEFCKTVVAQMTRHCDAIIDLIGKVNLATYIGQANAAFRPYDQGNEGTCYAHAIAAVFHLAMNRIVGREGGIPQFEEIRDRLIKEYGKYGANTETVLSKVCPEYRLHFKKIDETGARKAINERRPVVCRFSWDHKQIEKFVAYYDTTPKGILLKSDVQLQEAGLTGFLFNISRFLPFIGPRYGGHAVVLTTCHPDCLRFMNSWGPDFADGGFFRVKDQAVLDNTTFYDVYWNESDLTESEKKAYEENCAKKLKEYAHDLPSIQEVPYKCPKCEKTSNVAEFLGDISKAQCPECKQTFKPTNTEMLQSLYARANDL